MLVSHDAPVGVGISIAQARRPQAALSAPLPLRNDASQYPGVLCWLGRWGGGRQRRRHEHGGHLGAVSSVMGVVSSIQRASGGR